MNIALPCDICYNAGLRTLGLHLRVHVGVHVLVCVHVHVNVYVHVCMLVRVCVHQHMTDCAWALIQLITNRPYQQLVCCRTRCPGCCSQNEGG